MNVHDFVQALAIVLCVAALATLIFHRLKQPVVLGYILAGLVIGPHVPVPLVADLTIVRTLSEVGVILLMFSLGLEFSVRKLLRVGATATVTAVIECGLMLWLGYTAGRALGWSQLDSVFAGAIVAISSTTIVAKAFGELKVQGKLREVVFSVLIVEDLVAILLMAVLTAAATGAGLSAMSLAATAGKLAAFLVGLVVAGLLIVPRAVRLIVSLRRPETTLVASMGICFAFSLLAMQLGYSVALGAFLAGSLVAESGEEASVETVIRPVRDVFAAIFFVSVGMLLDPAVVAQHWSTVLVFAVVVIVGKTLGVSLGTFLTGSGVRTAVQAGMSMAQIGEFSFIIAGVGLATQATGTFLYPVAITVSAITTLTTPSFMRLAAPVALFVDRKLPGRLQTFVMLYGSWIEHIKSAPKPAQTTGNVRRLFRLLLLDAALLLAVQVGLSVAHDALARLVDRSTGIGEVSSRLVVFALMGALAIPLLAGIVRVSRALGGALAERALPPAHPSRSDLAAAPRRVLVVTLQLTTLLVVGVPLLALTQPFLPGFPTALLLGLVFLLLGIRFWRSTENLHGHVRAGAEAIIDALKAQTADSAERHADPMADVRSLLPGIGEPVTHQLEASSPAVGRTLAELNLRGLTGATVLAIKRGSESAVVPAAKEPLREGDLLALAGSEAAITAAVEILRGTGP